MYRSFLRECFIFILIVFFILSPGIPARSEKIIVVATPLDEVSSGSVVDKSPTAFAEVVKVSPSSYGLIDTEEAIRMAASIDLPDYGGAVTAPASIRGSNFQQTLIMLDGMVLTPVTGDLVDLSLYSIPEIEQVEIIRGSNSAVYGKSSMGGVINIVTKSPAFEDRFRFTSSQGSYGYSLYNAHLNSHINDIGIMVSLTRAKAENDYLYEREDGSTIRRQNNDSLNVSGLTKIWFDISGWDTLITGNLIDQASGSPGSEGSAGMLTPNDEVKIWQDSFMVDTSKDLTRAQQIHIRASRLGNRTHNQTSFAGDTWTRLTNETLSLTYSKDFGPVLVSPEIALLKEGINSDDYGIHSRTTGSGIANATMKFHPLLLNLTLRYDNSSDFEGRWTYHSGTILELNRHINIKANVGTGYREPTMGHLYTPSTWYTFVPNEELDPEKSVGWDIGPSINYDNIGIGASYYVSDYSDLIKMDFPAQETFTYINVDKAHASGVEAYTWIRPTDLTRVSLNYSFNQFRYASGITESKKLKQKPQEIFGLQLNFLPEIKKKPTDIYLAYHFREGFYTDDANTEKTGNRNILDAGVSVDLLNNATLSFKGNNLLDDTSVEYEDMTSWGNFWYPVPGRTYRFSMQVYF